ncbi:hypothetical protein D3C85_1453040 [compost metagenome]
MLLHRAVVLGEYLRGFRILRHGFGHQRQQRAGVDPVTVGAHQVNSDKTLERIHSRLPLRGLVRHQRHKAGIDETRQGAQQPGLVAEMVGCQTAAVTGLLPDF